MVRESMTPADSRYFLKASFFCSVACGVTSRGGMEGNAKSGTAGGLLEMRVCRSKTGARRAGNRVMPAPAGASRRLRRHELGLTMVWGDARRSSVRCGGRAELCARERTRGNLHGLIHPAS